MNMLVVFLVTIFTIVAYGDHEENNHLVTMKKGELMKILHCIDQSKSPVFCKTLERCNEELPDEVNKSLEKCKKEHLINGERKCDSPESVFHSLETPSKLFDCIASKTHELSIEEDMQMERFEICARKLHEQCKKYKPSS